MDVVDAYGSRETGGIANNGKVNPRVDVKLLDVPELGYFSNGNPPRGILFFFLLPFFFFIFIFLSFFLFFFHFSFCCPFFIVIVVGEIAVHSRNMITGYWNEDELNAKSFVVIDGTTYYKTGDIGEYPKKQMMTSSLLIF